MAITSENKNTHASSSRINRKEQKKERKTTSCMSVLFLVNEYFRVQRNLFNYLWNLKYFAYRKEIPKG